MNRCHRIRSLFIFKSPEESLDRCSTCHMLSLSHWRTDSYTASSIIGQHLIIWPSSLRFVNIIIFSTHILDDVWFQIYPRFFTSVVIFSFLSLHVQIYFRNSFSHMTLEDLVAQLHEQGISAVTIHTRLVEIFGPLAIAYWSVTWIARSASWTGNSSARSGRPQWTIRWISPRFPREGLEWFCPPDRWHDQDSSDNNV
jgi:hypothetical protein